MCSTQLVRDSPVCRGGAGGIRSSGSEWRIDADLVRVAPGIPGVTEMRPGTYIFNDRNTWLLGGCAPEDCAAWVVATVVSTSVSGSDDHRRRIEDVLFRPVSLAGEPGFGYLPEAPGAVFGKMNEEHGFVDILCGGGAASGPATGCA